MSYTLESERAVIGCLIMFPEKFGEYVPLISDELFADPVRKEIFRLLSDAFKKYDRVDMPILLSQLDSETLRQEAYICAEKHGFKSTPIENHLQLLAEAAKEQIINEEYNRLLLDGGEDLVGAIRAIADKADSIYSPAQRESVYEKYVEGLTAPRKVLNTRFKEIDLMTGGFERGSLIILGARPSVGKTTFALNIAQNIAEYGRKVDFFSLEMTATTILDKIVARGLHIDAFGMKRGADKDLREGIGYYFSDSGMKDNLTVIDDISSVEHIVSRIQKDKPDVAVVDYCQIVQTVEKQDSVRTKIDYISASLKQTAKRTGCCVILLSQLKRPDGAVVKPPTMADLKESSGLEQDGDYIFLLYRPFVQDKSIGGDGKFNHKPSETFLILEKNKFGRTGMFEFDFDLSHQDFKEVVK